MIAALPAAVTPPPTDMPTPPVPLLVATVTVGSIVGLAFLASLWHWRRSGSPVAPLVLLGGLLCSLNEAAIDVLSQCWFPEGSITVYTMYDRPIPLWVVLAYVGYFGGLTYLTVRTLRSGATRARMWGWIGTIFVLNLCLELPFLLSGLYQYYGPQPLEVLGMPLPYLVVNALGSTVAAFVVVRFWDTFTGARALLLLAVPYVTYMASWPLAMPYFGLVGADVGQPVRVAGALVSMALGLLAIDLLIRSGVRHVAATRAAAPPADATAVPERVPARR